MSKLYQHLTLSGPHNFIHLLYCRITLYWLKALEKRNNGPQKANNSNKYKLS